MVRVKLRNSTYVYEDACSALKESNEFKYIRFDVDAVYSTHAYRNIALLFENACNANLEFDSDFRL